MSLTLLIPSVQWMSTRLRYSWEDTIPLSCTIPARTRCLQLLSSLIWSLLLNSVREYRSGIILLFVHGLPIKMLYLKCHLSLSLSLQVKTLDGDFEQFHSVLSILSYLLKAPMVPPGTPVVNALFRQRACIENIFR